MKAPVSIILTCILLSFLFSSFISGKKTANTKLITESFSKKVTEEKPVANPYYIIIYKKSYELKVYDDKGWYATYPCVFGSNDLRDKFMQGDKRTPEGHFKVVLKKNNSKWKFELLLNYPNEQSYKKFVERKSEGLIPGTAKIGGGIAIHATRPQEEWTVDYYQNWNDGCISLKYSEAADLYSYIPVGTPVIIRK
jgi:murein L,D-transpeptidase YafK